jgi:hypothetical protein
MFEGVAYGFVQSVWEDDLNLIQISKKRQNLLHQEKLREVKNVPFPTNLEIYILLDLEVFCDISKL